MAHVRRLSIIALFSFLGFGCSESHSTSEPVVDGGSRPDAWIVEDDAPIWTPDAPVWVDVGPPPSQCAAQDAHEQQCPGAFCDGLDSYAWDGEQCIVIDCGTCMGADCAGLPRTIADCQAAHATCIPEMCRDTGGEWLFYAEECLPYHCGLRQPAECLIGMPVCNCGDGRSFDPARGGCYDDTTCPVITPRSPSLLCSSTGGAWTDGICCDSHCGQPCALACASPACVCGALQVFDPQLGCVDDAACHVAPFGGTCDDQIRCGHGQICCQTCTGAGCDPDRRCIAPVCDSDPHIDTCGNHLLSP